MIEEYLQELFGMTKNNSKKILSDVYNDVQYKEFYIRQVTCKIKSKDKKSYTVDSACYANNLYKLLIATSSKLKSKVSQCNGNKKCIRDLNIAIQKNIDMANKLKNRKK